MLARQCQSDGSYVYSIFIWTAPFFFRLEKLSDDEVKGTIHFFRKISCLELVFPITRLAAWMWLVTIFTAVMVNSTCFSIDGLSWY